MNLEWDAGASSRLIEPLDGALSCALNHRDGACAISRAVGKLSTGRLAPRCMVAQSKPIGGLRSVTPGWVNTQEIMPFGRSSAPFPPRLAGDALVPCVKPYRD